MSKKRDDLKERLKALRVNEPLKLNGEMKPPVARTEVPQNEVAQRESATPQGFFKLSHGVFGEPLLRDLSGDCFRLFLWLSSRAWRYPTSGGVVRASVGYIELHAGMSHATISRGLKTLKEKGLITALESRISPLTKDSSMNLNNQTTIPIGLKLVQPRKVLSPLKPNLNNFHGALFQSLKTIEKAGPL